MREVCGRYVLLSAYEVVENACVSFNERVAGIEKERGIPENTLVTHGLASVHTHLGLYPIRTTLTSYTRLDDWVVKYAWRWEKLLRREPELSYASAILALRKLVLGGATAVADMHFNEGVVAEAFQRIGVRGDLSIAIMSKGVYESFEEALTENIELVKKFRGSNLLKTRFGPTTPRLLSPAEFKEVVGIAREMDVGIHTHIAEVPEDSVHLKEAYGMSLEKFIEFVGLREVNTIVAHGVWLDAGSVKALTHPNITLAHCPSSNTLLRDGVAPIRSYIDEGVRVALGVDVSPGFNLLDEIVAALSLHLGRGDIDLRELLNAATTVGYQALEAGRGIIEIGEPADIVLWSIDEPPIDPAAGLMASAKVVEVYVEGRKVVEEGSLIKISDKEVEEIRREVSRYCRKCFTG